MKLLRTVILAAPLLLLAVSLVSGRSILEKKMYFVSEAGKTAEARFWVVFLGNYDCTVNRNIPGEGTVAIKASFNLQMISSGYTEGNGHGSKGKIDCLPVMNIKNAAGEEKIITLDSIDYIFDYGQKVCMLSGEKGDLVIDIEGTKVTAKRFVLSEYKLTDYYGEQILKSSAEPDLPLQALSFSKEGALRAGKGASATSTAK